MVRATSGSGAGSHPTTATGWSTCRSSAWPRRWSGSATGCSWWCRRWWRRPRSPSGDGGRDGPTVGPAVVGWRGGRRAPPGAAPRSTSPSSCSTEGPHHLATTLFCLAAFLLLARARPGGARFLAGHRVLLAVTVRSDPVAIAIGVAPVAGAGVLDAVWSRRPAALAGPLVSSNVFFSA